jgi:hypothetical protein
MAVLATTSCQNDVADGKDSIGLMMGQKMDGGKDARYLIDKMLLPFSLFHFSIDFKGKQYVAKNVR